MHIAWTRADFEREMNENKLAIYFVAKDGPKIVGYAGMWHVVTEGPDNKCGGFGGVQGPKGRLSAYGGSY